MNKQYEVYQENDGSYTLLKWGSNGRSIQESVFSSIEELDTFLKPNKNQLELFPLEEVIHAR